LTASRPPRCPITFVLGAKPSPTLDPTASGAGPAVDVVEHDGGYILVVEVPGADAARLQVEVKGRRVTVRGERLPTDGEAGRFLRVERAVGPFERTIELPEEPDPERAEASFGDGLLRIELARRTVSRSREIKIGRPAGHS
jgi:HSP20 family protein